MQILADSEIQLSMDNSVNVPRGLCCTIKKCGGNLD